MASKSKPGLGRGLAALIPDRTRTSTAGGAEEVDIDLVVPNPQQPRTRMDAEDLESLADSIRTHGVIQPLLVSRSSGPGATVYQLIAGERRLRAARLAGLVRVPVVVREAAPRELLELALVENVQRSDLTALEEAQAYRRLIEEFALTQEAVAERVGRSRVSVTNTLRLLGLPAALKLALANGEITEGHARALLGLTNNEARKQACALVVREGMSVRATEDLVRRWEERTGEQAPTSRLRTPADPEVAAVEERLRNALGTKVQLVRGPKGGRVIIHFFSDDELEGLLAVLGGRSD